MPQTPVLLSSLAPQGVLEAKARALGLEVGALRGFFRLPSDGSGDDDFVQECVDFVARRKTVSRSIRDILDDPVFRPLI